MFNILTLGAVSNVSLKAKALAEVAVKQAVAVRQVVKVKIVSLLEKVLIVYLKRIGYIFYVYRLNSLILLCDRSFIPTNFYHGLIEIYFCTDRNNSTGIDFGNTSIVQFFNMSNTTNFRYFWLLIQIATIIP